MGGICRLLLLLCLLLGHGFHLLRLELVEKDPNFILGLHVLNHASVCTTHLSDLNVSFVEPANAFIITRTNHTGVTYTKERKK